MKQEKIWWITRWNPPSDWDPIGLAIVFCTVTEIVEMLSIGKFPTGEINATRCSVWRLNSDGTMAQFGGEKSHKVAEQILKKEEEEHQKGAQR